MRTILSLTPTSVAPSLGVDDDSVGTSVSTTVKVALAAVIACPQVWSSTVASIATYTFCCPVRLLSGLIVITFLSESIVASKAISAPLELFTFKVIRLSTLVLVKVLSSVLRIAWLKVNVMFSEGWTSSSELAGSKVTVGRVVFVNVPLPVVVVPATKRQSPPVSHVPEELIVKSLSTSTWFVDCVPALPLKITL